MWRKLFIGALATAFFITGCSKKEESTDSKVMKDDKIFTIVMNEKNKMDLKEVTDLIEEKYGMQVEVKNVSDEEKRKMMFSEKADMVLLSQNEIGFAKDEGLIKDVKVDTAKYIPSTVNALKYEGKQYGIPATFDVPVFVYNPEFIKNQPKVWDELKEYATVEKVQEKPNPEIQKVEQSKLNIEAARKGVKPKKAEEPKDITVSNIISPYATYFSTDDFAVMEPVLRSFGFQLFNQVNGVYQGTNFGFNMKDGEKGLQTLKTWRETFLPKESLTNDEIADKFNNKELYSFVGYRSQLDNLEIPYETSNIPNVEGDKKYEPFVTVQGWAIMKHVQNDEMVKDIFNMLSNEEFVKEQIKQFNYLTPIKLKDYEDKNILAAYKQAENGFSYPIMAEMQAVYPSMERTIQQYFDGIVNEKEALENAKLEIDTKVSSDYGK